MRFVLAILVVLMGSACLADYWYICEQDTIRVRENQRHPVYTLTDSTSRRDSLAAVGLESFYQPEKTEVHALVGIIEDIQPSGLRLKDFPLFDRSNKDGNALVDGWALLSVRLSHTTSVESDSVMFFYCNNPTSLYTAYTTYSGKYDQRLCVGMFVAGIYFIPPPIPRAYPSLGSIFHPHANDQGYDPSEVMEAVFDLYSSVIND